VLKWLASKVQKPSIIPNVSLLFQSDQGTGKDTFFDWFGNNILGSQYYLNEDKAELLFGRFNSLIENRLLIVVNETSAKDTIQMITPVYCFTTQMLPNVT
jgi:hypothetical protein